LNIGVATQAATLQATAQFTHYTGGTGNTATYFTLNNQVVVGGAVVPAKISAFVDITSMANFGNSDIIGQITSKYANAATVKIVSVTFPAGATSIIYDPSYGAGSTPPTIGSSGKIAFSFALFFFLLALVF